MSDERSIEMLRLRAEGCRSRGDIDGAITHLEAALAIDPTLGDVHAVLALCLVERRLLDVARAEAELAMSLDPDEAICHRALSQVLLAEGQLRAALRELENAAELDPSDADTHVGLSLIKRLLGEDGEPDLERARELAPEDPAVLTAWSEFELGRGNVDEAERYAREALEIDSELGEAILAMGWVLLRRGRVDEAREHAAMALHQDPDDGDALRLLAACRARQSFVLGLWFRFNMYTAELGDRGSIALLLALYIAYRLLWLILVDLGYEQVAALLSYVWLAFAAYTWLGPMIFQRMLEREIGKLELDPDY